MITIIHFTDWDQGKWDEGWVDLIQSFAVLMENG